MAGPRFRRNRNPRQSALLLDSRASAWCFAARAQRKQRPSFPYIPCATQRRNRSRIMGTILLIILILILIGALPTWPHSRSWGYYPSGGLGLVVLILIILVLMGRI